jgi:hypothetical protein
MVTTKKSLLFTLTVIFFSLFNTTPSNAQMQLVVSVTGSVTDLITKKPTTAVVSFYDGNNKKIGWSRSNSNTGYYLVTGLKPNGYYKIIVESLYYIREEYEIQIPNVAEYTTFTKDIELIPIKK